MSVPEVPAIVHVLAPVFVPVLILTLLVYIFMISAMSQ